MTSAAGPPAERRAAPEPARVPLGVLGDRPVYAPGEGLS